MASSTTAAASSKYPGELLKIDADKRANNFAEFAKQFENIANAAGYPTTITKVVSSKYVPEPNGELAPPAMQEDDLPASTLEKMRGKDVVAREVARHDKHKDAIVKHTVDKQRFYAYIKTGVDPNTEMLLTSLVEGYQQLDIDKNPVMLWAALKKFATVGFDDSEAARIMRAVNAIRQLTNNRDETPTMFLNRYEKHVDALELAGGRAETEPVLALDFLQKLNDERLKPFKTDMLNKLKNGEDVPATAKLMAIRAQQHDKSPPATVNWAASAQTGPVKVPDTSKTDATSTSSGTEKCVGGCGQLKTNHPLENCRTLQQILKTPEAIKIVQDRKAAMDSRKPRDGGGAVGRKERNNARRGPDKQAMAATTSEDDPEGQSAFIDPTNMYLAFAASADPDGFLKSDGFTAMSARAQQHALLLNKQLDKIVDSGAEINITGNLNHVRKLKSLDREIAAKGIAGTMRIEQVGECTTTGSPMYYHKDMPMTIISYGAFDNNYNFVGSTSRINDEGCTVASSMEWAPKRGNVVEAQPAYFERLQLQGPPLFVLRQRPQDVHALSLSEENQLVTVIGKLERARQFVRSLGYPGQLAAKTLLKRVIEKAETKGAKNDVPITTDDVEHSYELYGRRPEDAGKSRAAKSKVSLPADRSTIPEGKRKVRLHVDVFFIGGMPFLISVASVLFYVIITVLTKQDTATMHSTLMNLHVAPYAARGVEVTTVHSDSAAVFLALEPLLAAPTGGGKPIEMTFVAPNQHEVTSEREIQTAKMFGRSITAGVKLDRGYDVARSLYPHLMFAVANNLNSLPVANETDATPPSEALYGEAYDFKRSEHAFGDPVSCKASLDESEKKTLSSREEFGIIITHATHDQGWWVFLPETKKVVNRKHVTRTVMTHAQVEEMNKMAKQDDAQAKKKKGYFPLDDWKTRDGEAVREAADTFVEQPSATNVANAQEERPSIPPKGEADAAAADAGSAPRGANEDAIDASAAASASRGVADETSKSTAPDVPDRPSEKTQASAAMPPPFLRVNTRANAKAIADKQREQDKLVARIEGKIANIMTGETERAETALSKIVGNFLDHELNKSRVHESVIKMIAYAESIGAIVETEGGTVMRLTVNKSQQEFGDANTEDSIIVELANLLDKELFEPQFKHLLTREQRTKVLRSSIFLKAKYNAVGEFIKLKARLVANGSQQDPKSYGEMDSPTVMMESLFMLTAISAHERRHNCTIDIVAAYLEAETMEGSEIYVELEALPSRLLVKLRPEYAKYLDVHGKFTGRLKKALYGLIESAHQFWKKLSSALKSTGFVSNDKDECVMNKTVGGHQVSIACFSDDMYMSCKSLSTLNATIEEIRKLFPNIVVHHGPVIDYLGMSMDFSVPGECQVAMPAYMSHIIGSCPIALRPNIKISEKSVPADPDIFLIDDKSATLDEKKKEEFHSVVMQIFYVAKRHRSDCLLAISFLTKRVQAPTEQDWSKLKNLLQYLSDTKGFVMILRPSLGIRIIAFVDASYGVHMDMKSQSGLVLTIGGAPICCKARTQQLNTKSSTEAEIVALGDAGSMIIWARDFLICQGHESAEEPSVVFEDNMSTIALIKKGKATQPQTRHIKIRFFFLSDYIKRKEVEIVYKETKMMIADMFTKPLPFHEFNRMRTMLMNSKV